MKKNNLIRKMYIIITNVWGCAEILPENFESLK